MGEFALTYSDIGQKLAQTGAASQQRFRGSAIMCKSDIAFAEDQNLSNVSCLDNTPSPDRHAFQHRVPIIFVLRLGAAFPLFSKMTATMSRVFHFAQRTPSHV